MTHLKMGSIMAIAALVLVVGCKGKPEPKPLTNDEIYSIDPSNLPQCVPDERTGRQIVNPCIWGAPIASKPGQMLVSDGQSGWKWETPQDRPIPQWRLTGEKTKEGELIGDYTCPYGWTPSGGFSYITGEVMPNYGLRCITKHEQRALVR